MNKPTTFYLFSDGIQDQFGGERGRKFSIKRLRKLLEDNHLQPMPAQKQNIEQAIDEWQSSSQDGQIDDMLMIGVKVFQ